MRITVVGAGSWGTALGKVWAEKGHEVRLLARRPALAEAINSRKLNPDYLPEIELPENLKAFIDPGQALTKTEVVVWAVPCQHLREVAQGVRDILPRKIPLISAIKGLEIATFKTPVEILGEIFPENPRGVLSGPSFALEVARGLPTAVVLAFEEESLARELQEALSTSFFRLYRSQDVRGVEICGAVKNVMAIAAGISDGLELGLNARAALITRGLAEMMRLGLTRGAEPFTFSGLAGLGDLVLTCTGRLSRNYTVGYRLGRGEELEEILGSLHQVAEGVYTVKALYRFAQGAGLELPITEGVYQVLYEKEDPRNVLRRLLSRPLKAEFEPPLRP
ncbi:NAD(P)-dependent glycerol-3-phosphate dehydrogenase [Thermosulfurimonas marina]|uniref:Glycerol-3-phosphate dehydrogenase [NAD(P)+] n=1 Tax=Thermosulfurimonas marina TaxID=2047767 RepID=A0A6H1WQI2_9BACT|nr:NAD(P)H-dependent glycerol-3-phosphate dehydrogenase [Thermosulfurimonas marina]QJA05414.1 NAD(P)-dependent glycerol-3-phosphate dehydrogenase [Thermosulfurimonas marina]